MILNETLDKMPLRLTAGVREIKATELLHCDGLHLFKKPILLTVLEIEFVVPL
jgi:hypothetical protein